MSNQCRQGGYVRVYGTIRVFKEEKAIVGTSIAKIEKFDEVTNHFLKVFVSHCQRKKGVLTKERLTEAPSHTTARANVDLGTADLRQLVLSIMSELSRNSKYVNKRDVLSLLGGRMRTADLDDVLTTLANDGAIYTAYDNDVYSITEA